MASATQYSELSLDGCERALVAIWMALVLKTICGVEEQLFVMLLAGLVDRYSDLSTSSCWVNGMGVVL